MTLVAAAQRVLTASESGILENTEEPLRELQRLASAAGLDDDVSAALPILLDARRAVYALRSQITQSLRTAKLSGRYCRPGPRDPLWEITG